MRLGRDFSSFQGNLTDADVAGIDFAYVKITEGANYKNPDAVQQVAKLREHGVKIGYYHFLDEPGSILGDQLDNFHKMAQALGHVDLPLAVDCEQKGSSWTALAADMVQFAINVESWNLWVPNRRSVFYVDVAFYDNLGGIPWGRWTWLADPNPGAPHKPCLILQGAPRPVSSVDLKSVDPDTFMGTDADWAAFTGVAYAPIAPATPTLVTISEDTLQVATGSFTTDAQGNAWIASPVNVNDVVNVVAVANDPRQGGYSHTPRFAGITADGQLVFEGGAPNARFGYRVFTVG